MRHEESETQRACYKWFSIQYREYGGLLFSVPNGARVTRTQAAVLRAEGLTSGVSDMILLVPRHGYHGIMIEFKTRDGRQSDAQKHFQDQVERQGYLYCIVRSCEGFMRIIRAYLGADGDVESARRHLKELLNQHK